MATYASPSATRLQRISRERTLALLSKRQSPQQSGSKRIISMHSHPPCNHERFLIAVVLMGGLVSGCGGDGGGGAPPPGPPGGGPTPGVEEERRGRAPIPVPPNASLVVATIVEVPAAAATTSRARKATFGAPTSAYPVRIKVDGSQPEQDGQNSLAVPGTTYTAYSSVPVDPQLKNRQINARLTLNGTSYEVWWDISQIIPRQ